jgi:two-component system, LytTR family, response regulator
MGALKPPRASFDDAELSESMDVEPPLEQIAVRSRREIVVLHVESIDWIGAADNYVEIHAHGTAHLLREPLQEIERRLDPRRFARIHRGIVVNLDRIDRLRTRPGGDPEATLHDGTRLPVGRSYAARLLARWDGPRS